MPFYTIGDFENYLQRLNKLPRQVRMSIQKNQSAMEQPLSIRRLVLSASYRQRLGYTQAAQTEFYLHESVEYAVGGSVCGLDIWF